MGSTRNSTIAAGVFNSNAPKAIPIRLLTITNSVNPAMYFHSTDQATERPSMSETAMAAAEIREREGRTEEGQGQAAEHLRRDHPVPPRLLGEGDQHRPLPPLAGQRHDRHQRQQQGQDQRGHGEVAQPALLHLLGQEQRHHRGAGGE